MNCPKDCRCESCLLRREAEDHQERVRIITAQEVEAHHNSRVCCQDCIALNKHIAELERTLGMFSDETNWTKARGTNGPEYIWNPRILAFDRPWKNAQTALEAK